MSSKILEGRVLIRRKAWEELPNELKVKSDMCASQIIAHKDEVFSSTKISIFKSVWCVKGDVLLRCIKKCLEQSSDHISRASSSARNEHLTGECSSASVEYQDTHIVDDKQDVGQGAKIEKDMTVIRTSDIYQPLVESVSNSMLASTTFANMTIVDQCQQVARALILKGLISPLNYSSKKEKRLVPVPHLNYIPPAPVHAQPAPPSTTPRVLAPTSKVSPAVQVLQQTAACEDQDSTEYVLSLEKYVHPDNLFLPVASEVSISSKMSVWSLVDGVIYAAWIKRKAGVLSGLSLGKKNYLVANSKRLCVAIFKNDIALYPKIVWDCSLTQTWARIEGDYYTYGLRIWNGEQNELVDGHSAERLDKLISAVIASGARYHESEGIVDTLDWQMDETLRSWQAEETYAGINFFDCSDYDIYNKPIQMSKYKNHVLLIVNIPCHGEFAQTQEFNELSVLYDKFSKDGLQILLFPSTQFCALKNIPNSRNGIREPARQQGRSVRVYDGECLSQMLHMNGKNYSLFAIDDINGIHTRSLYRYLKFRISGPFGQYIRGNFTKYLIDSTGLPVRRFEPEVPMCNIEKDIATLLNRNQTIHKNSDNHYRTSRELQSVALDPQSTLAEIRVAMLGGSDHLRGGNEGESNANISQQPE